MIKRYELSIDAELLNDVDWDIEESHEGEWVKWNDIEVAMSVINDRSRELETSNKALLERVKELEELSKDS